MFGPKHYVPILKGKVAEFTALAHLREKTTESTTPLVEIVPPKEGKPAGKRLRDSAEKLYEVRVERRVFVDLAHLDGLGTTESEEAFRYLFAQMRRRGPAALPATSIGRSPSYQASVKAACEADGRGILLRVTAADLQNANFPLLVDRLLGLLGLAPEGADLLLDYSAFKGDWGTLAEIERIGIASLPHLSEWRSFSIAAGSAPETLGGIQTGRWVKTPRLEWLAWLSLWEGRAKLPRMPSYSDYGVHHPALPYGGGQAPPNLRYSAGRDFMTYRGEKPAEGANSYGGIFAICEDLVGRDEFPGRGFSRGDSEIWQRATSRDSTGSPQSWKEWALSHYFELVASQLSSLPSP